MSVSAQMKKRRIYFMKRKAGMIAASFMVMALAAGCGQKEAQAPAATAAPTTAAPTTEAATTAAETTKAEETTKAQETTAAKEESKGAEGGYKTGLAIVSSMASSKEPADGKDGTAQVDSVAVAVVVDEDGKIVNCYIDTAQNKMGFTAEGKAVIKEDFQTKKELGEKYGMKAASGIGKEWDEQAAALEEYVIGKTAEEVAGIAVDDTTKPTDVDLVAGVTSIRKPLWRLFRMQRLWELSRGTNWALASSQTCISPKMQRETKRDSARLIPLMWPLPRTKTGR